MLDESRKDDVVERMKEACKLCTTLPRWDGRCEQQPLQWIRARDQSGSVLDLQREPLFLLVEGRCYGSGWGKGRDQDIGNLESLNA